MIWFVRPFSRDVSWNGSQERSAKATWPERINSRPIAIVTDFFPFLLYPAHSRGEAAADSVFFFFFFVHWWCLYFDYFLLSRPFGYHLLFRAKLSLSLSYLRLVCTKTSLERFSVSATLFHSQWSQTLELDPSRRNPARSRQQDPLRKRTRKNRNEWPISDKEQILLAFWGLLLNSNRRWGYPEKRYRLESW